MAAIVNENLAGFTVTYNGVQFGGADATYKSFPPMYRLVGRERYSGDGRTLVGIEYMLSVRCIFYENTEAAMGASMAAIRSALSQPSKKLTILGIGNLFGTTGVIQGTGDPSFRYKDLKHGPIPGPIEMTSLGQITWEVGWSVSFFVSECSSSGRNALAFTELVFSTTWRNDFEGISQRIIQGYYTIASNRNLVNSKVMDTIADQVRNQLTVVVPVNFKRVENIWHESEDKTRVDFTVIDQQLPGDPYPKGIVSADGSCSLQSSAGEDNRGMLTSICTLNMTLKTAPNVPRNLASRVFLAACLAKQAELTAPDVNGLATITVMPLAFNISNGKWDSSRVTQCSMSWVMIKTLGECLTAANIYASPNSYLAAIETGLGPTVADGVNDYTQWAKSMTTPWRNTGMGGLTNALSDGIAIDLCDNSIAKTIGNVAGVGYNPAAYALTSLTCPNIPANGGWIYAKFDVRVHVEENTSTHRRAAAYLPDLPHTITDPLLGTDTPLPGPYYQQDLSDQHITEHNGQPESLVGITFAGLRYKNKPFMPNVGTVQGMAATRDSGDNAAATLAFEVFGCQVWKITGYNVYKVPGIVTRIKAISPVDASTAAMNDKIKLDL